MTIPSRQQRLGITLVLPATILATGAVVCLPLCQKHPRVCQGSCHVTVLLYKKVI